MAATKLEKIYCWINNLGPNVKTVTIILLMLVTICVGFKNYAKTILKDYTEQVQKDKQLAEEYTKIITPYVNDCIEKILIADEEASNVILLNYHNTLTSTHGLSYRYLTSLVEKKRGLETKSCLRVWKELEYINYGEEIEKINDNKYLRMNGIDNYKSTLPNLTELLKLSRAQSAAFYPIQGISGPIGMVVVMYQKEKVYRLGYYQSVITPAIHPLISLLDYNSVKDRFKELKKEGIPSVESLID